MFSEGLAAVMVGGKYPQIPIKLVFNGIVLVGWQTDNTVGELKMKGNCK